MAGKRWEQNLLRRQKADLTPAAEAEGGGKVHTDPQSQVNRVDGRRQPERTGLLSDLKGRNITLLFVHKIPHPVTTARVCGRKHSQTMAFWRRHFAQGISRIYLFSEGNTWRTVPPAFLNCPESCCHQQECKKLDWEMQTLKSELFVREGPCFKKTEFLELQTGRPDTRLGHLR